MFSFFNLKRPSDFGKEKSTGPGEGQPASDSRRSSRSGRGSEPPSQPGGTQASSAQDESSLPSQAVQHSQGPPLSSYSASVQPRDRLFSEPPLASPRVSPRPFGFGNNPFEEQNGSNGHINHRHSYVDHLPSPDRFPPYLDQFSEEGSVFEQGLYLHPPAMATNGRPPSRPPLPNSRGPPGPLRPMIYGATPGPPPTIAPPPIPSSPGSGRKLSLQAPSPNSAMFQRPPEKMGDTKLIKFGENKLRSPSPGRNATIVRNGPERKVSAPPAMNYSPLPFNVNGSSDMQNFQGLLEHEEADFVDQVKKSKAFIQKVIKDKEELGMLVANHTSKIKKLEVERMDYQKRIIEAEREKRDFNDKLEHERQGSLQALQRIEQQKQEYEKLHQESTQIARERNEAVSRLNLEMKELEKLERDRREMMAKIDDLSKEQNQKKTSIDMSKNVGDLNMKLKMEIGALRSENEGLLKKNDDIRGEVTELDNQIQNASRTLRQKDSEVQQSQSRIENLSQELAKLRKQLETAQEEAKRQSFAESETKVENAQLKSEHVAATDKIQKLQKEILKIEAEKKDNVNKIQVMHAEMKELRRTLEDFEANKSQEIANLQASLTKSLLANREVTENFDKERKLVVEMENANSALQEQIEKLQIDSRKQQADAKNYLDTIKNKKKVEEELLETIQEIKDKVEKYEEEKKAIAKAERMRKSSVATQEKVEKKEWEEKMEKLKIQFDKAAVESKKNITKLTEENTKSAAFIEEIKTDLEKKQVECRTLNTKLTSMDKEFTRYKTWSKGETDKYEKTIEELEQKLGEGRRSAESWKRKHDSVQNDLESVIKEKYNLQEQIEHLNEEILSLKENQTDEIAQQQNEKTKLEQRLREANHKIKNLEHEKTDLQKKSDNEIEDLTSKVTSLKSDLKKSSLEKDNLVKRIERITSEKDSSVAAEVEARDNTITEKENEISDLKEAADVREQKLKSDIDKEVEERTKVVNKMNSELDKVKTEISSKQNQIGKLEKEKRELSITQDKTQKQLNEIECEKTKLKDVLTKLESEKKQNNFGKYEREKMKLEIDNMTKEKQTVANRLEEITREKHALNEKIKDLSKLDVVKNELSSKNDELNDNIKDLNKKCKDLESNNKKEKDTSKTKEKSLSDQLRSVTNEKDKLQDKIDELTDSVKKQERELNIVNGDLKTTKSNLEEKEEQCKNMNKDDNKGKALSDRITVLEKQKYDLDKKSAELETEKSSLSYKVNQMEKEKDTFNSKIKILESVKEELSKKLKDVEQKVKSTTPSSNDKKEDLTKLQKENQALKKDKDELGKSLKQIEKDLRKNIKDVKPNKVQGELKKLAEKIEKNTLVPANTNHLTNGTECSTGGGADAQEMKANFDALQKDFESRTSEIEKLQSTLSRSKTDCNAAVEKLRKSESELCQIKEKNAQLSDELLNKSRVIVGLENGGAQNSGSELQRQVDNLKKKLLEAQNGKVKKSVKFNAEPEILTDSAKPGTVKELEEQLEAAYAERNEIIVTCRKEVEFHRTIASELETSIMEDFEWKLHEMEKDYNSKLKYSKEKVDEQIKEACRGILREKDDEINKLQIKLRKDMDEKLKKEREELQKALESVKGGNSEAAMAVIKKEKETELANKQKKWEEKRKKYHKEIEDIKKKLNDKEAELKKAVENVRRDNDSGVIEERKKFEKMSEKFQEDHDKLKDELNGQMTRLRADYDEKIEDYEQRLEKALADKVEKMLVLREEVEVEYADKMDELRTMYRDEMNNQVGLAEKEKSKMQSLESSLQESLRTKRHDYDDVKLKYDEAISKVDDLERRLNNQTEEVIRLTAELENYEYADAE